MQPQVREKKTKWQVKGKWRPLIIFFYFMIWVEILWSELIRVQFSFIFLFDPSRSCRVDPARTGGPNFCTCLAKILVYPVPKISHIMVKWCRRASHLSRFTLWNNGRLATQLSRFTLWHNRRWASQLGRFTSWDYNRLATQLSRFTLWHNRCWTSQLGKFTLWHNGRRAKQPGLVHAYVPGVARIFQRKIVQVYGSINWC